MNIRDYRGADWRELCSIHDVARLDELAQASLSDAFLPLEIAAERECLFDYKILVAETCGKLLGFIAFDEEEIAWLYVEPDSYRKGVGRALVMEAVRSANTALTIEVLHSNLKAVQFYESCGFTLIGTDSGQMPGNEQFAVSVHILSNAVDV